MTYTATTFIDTNDLMHHYFRKIYLKGEDGREGEFSLKEVIVVESPPYKFPLEVTYKQEIKAFIGMNRRSLASFVNDGEDYSDW